MGTRIKTFDSTGTAPNGRLYAGDMNALQDDYADLSNYSQEVDAATFGIGETALKLLRYGAGEARVSGMLRTDGILRGLGGLYAGAFTTTQRDAIPLGSRPYGLLILNTTTNQYEWNKGTDTTPNWQAIAATASVTEVAIGSMMDWPWAAGSIPSWALLPFGQAISRTTYSTLNALASAAGYVYGNGDGSTTFNMPDYRGRIGIGLDNMGGTAANRVTSGISGINGASLGAVGGAEGVTLTTGQIPAHNHTTNESPHNHAHTDPGHSHSYYYWNGGNVGGISTLGTTQASDGSDSRTGGVISATTGITNQAASTGISINNAGGGGVHNNMPPSVVVNKIMRAI